MRIARPMVARHTDDHPGTLASIDRLGELREPEEMGQHRQTVVSSKAGLTTSFLPEPNLAEPRRGSWSGSRPSYVADSKPQRAPSCGAELSSWAGLGMVFSLILPAGAGRVNLTRVKTRLGTGVLSSFLGKRRETNKTNARRNASTGAAQRASSRGRWC